MARVPAKKAHVIFLCFPSFKWRVFLCQLGDPAGSSIGWRCPRYPSRDRHRVPHSAESWAWLSHGFPLLRNCDGQVVKPSVVMIYCHDWSYVINCFQPSLCLGTSWFSTMKHHHYLYYSFNVKSLSLSFSGAASCKCCYRVPLQNKDWHAKSPHAKIWKDYTINHLEDIQHFLVLIWFFFYFSGH